MTDDPTATVLLVEDDETTRTFLADNLCADGFDPLVAGTMREARHLAETAFPDIAIVDVTLPDGSGLDLVRAIRDADGLVSRADPALPILVLSGRGDELDRLRGFDRGADDYVVKPFSYPELHARLRAVLRRAERRRGQGRVRVGALELDAAARSVTVRGQGVALSQKEFTLLRHLAAEPTRVYTKPELMRAVWGTHVIGSSRTLDSHACRLRTKLGVFGDRFVLNVWGVGYRLCDGVAS